MHEAFWDGLLDVRWEDAPLGTRPLGWSCVSPEAAPVRVCGANAALPQSPHRRVKAAGAPGRTSSNGSKAYQRRKVM